MYPLRNFKFKLEIDKPKIEVGFSEVSGHDAKIKEITYREGNHTRKTVQKLPGLMEYGNITLKKGADDKNVFFEWLTNASVIYKEEPAKVTLSALADDGTTVLAVWEIENAWPVSYALSEFKGDGNEIVFETVTLTHEGMKRTK